MSHLCLSLAGVEMRTWIHIVLLCTGIVSFSTVILQSGLIQRLTDTNRDSPAKEVTPDEHNLVKKQANFSHRLTKHVIRRRFRSSGKHCPIKVPHNVTSTVEKFVFFIGYARSGHSIIGSILDAHPNIVIAHEYSLFNEWLTTSKQDLNRAHLYSAIYNNSCHNSHKGLRHRNAMKKGYTLIINGLWQGRYEKHITVIGDKSGGMTMKVFRTHRKEMPKAYKEFLEAVQVPVLAIHVVRNPFDNIATMLLYNNRIKKSVELVTKPYNDSKKLEAQVASYFHQVQSVVKMIDYLNLNVIEIHNSDLVNNPKRVIRRLCQQLELKCTKTYLEICSKAVFKKVSRSRFMVKWTPSVIDMVQKKIKTYPFLKHYSFFD